MIHCVFKTNKASLQAFSTTNLMKPFLRRETDLAYFIATEYAMKFPQHIYNRPPETVYGKFHEKITRMYKVASKYINSQRDIFQKFWNKNIFEINQTLVRTFGQLAKKNIIYNVYVNLVRDPISYITGNSFNVLYKLSNKKLLEECLYQIGIRLWHLQFRKIVGTQKHTKFNNSMQVLLGKFTILFFFTNGPFQKYRVRFPYEKFLTTLKTADKSFLVDKIYELYLNNSYENYLKKAWELLTKTDLYFNKIFKMAHTERFKYEFFKTVQDE